MSDPVPLTREERIESRPARRRSRWLRRDEGWDPRQDAGRLLVAIAVAVLAVGFKVVVVRGLGLEPAYLSYVGAVVIGAWIAGFRGGLVTTLICAVAEAGLFQWSGGKLASPNSVLGVGLFVLDGILVALITSRLRQTVVRERAARAESDALLAAQRAARESSERDRVDLAGLQAVTASLAGAATPAEVGAAILDRGLEVLGAVAGGISRLEEDGESLEVIAVRGYPEGVRPGSRSELEGGSPIRDVIESGDPVFLGCTREWLDRYPETPPHALADPKSTEGALAVLPLRSAGATLGVLVFRFDRPVDFGAGPGDLARHLGEQGAQALDRALAYARMHRARMELERGQDRLAFLALASEKLGSEPDLSRALSGLAELSVPLVADWCAIALFDADRPIAATAVKAPDLRPVVERLAEVLSRDDGPRLASDGDGGDAAIIEEGAAWGNSFADPDVRRAVEELGTRQLAVAPIDGDGGRPAGALILGASEPDRFDDSDQPFVRNLAERVGAAARQARLFAAATRFKAGVDASADAVYMFDPRSLRLTYVNRGGAELVGSEPTALLGRSLASIQPGYALAALEQLRGRNPPEGGIAYQGSLSRADGGELPIEAIIQEVSVGAGSTSVILTVRDITERIDVQARLSRIASDERRQASELRAVIQAMDEGIVVIGPDGGVSLANAAAMSIFGGDLPGDVAALRRRLGFDEEAALEAESGPGDGSAATESHIARLDDGMWVESRLYPVELGSSIADNTTSTIVVLRDVSRAREADAAREAFLGVLSHELRTPVTTIFGFAKVLQRRGRRADRAEILHDIEVEADRLYRIVEDLLALSRAESGLSIDGEPVLIQHLVEALVASEISRWPGVRFEVDMPASLPAALGDRTYVEQVLRNLISNAGKYSRPDSTVTVSARATPTEIVVRVLDRGVGFSDDEKEHLFQLFYRSPSSARVATGAGIGLYVARALVGAMGGRIWARPRAGGGSEFGFSLLPFTEPERRAAAASGRAGTGVSGRDSVE